MTKQEEVLNDERYRPLFNHGFVGLLDHMGSDADICRAARVSYGAGTKSVSDDRSLIRYLVRHRHTSTIEQAELKFHLKIPIFIMRQLVRHRTAKINEASFRYSVITDDYYIPQPDYLAPQSTTNKQGRSGELTAETKTAIIKCLDEQSQSAHAMYKLLLNEVDDTDPDYYDIKDYRQGCGFSEDYPGLARELARTIIPVNFFTELYWKCDLHNFFHMAKLRRDSHAQREIQDMANLMYELVKPHFPFACEAFEDYIMNSVSLSALDMKALKDVLKGNFVADDSKYGMSKRELNEFVERFVEAA